MWVALQNLLQKFSIYSPSLNSLHSNKFYLGRNIFCCLSSIQNDRHTSILEKKPLLMEVESLIPEGLQLNRNLTILYVIPWLPFTTDDLSPGFLMSKIYQTRTCLSLRHVMVGPSSTDMSGLISSYCISGALLQCRIHAAQFAGNCPGFFKNVKRDLPCLAIT